MFAKNQFSFSPKAIIAGFKAVFGKDTELATGGFSILDAVKTQDAERITTDEAQWLITALYADGEIDSNERALLDFIRAECPGIDESLKPLLDAA
jgi:hypothetical protein